MRVKNVAARAIAIPFFVTLFWVLAVAPGSAATGPDSVQVHPTKSKKVEITAGKSVIIESRLTIKRVSVAAPAIADVIVLTPRQVYITGKSPGTTSITFWDGNNNVSMIFDVDVVPDIARLKAELHEIFPQEKNLRATASSERITLAGTVSSTASLSQVLALVESYALVGKDGKPKIVNLLQVGGVHQVMIEVRVSEMSRSLGQRLGINFSTASASGKQFGVSLLNNLTAAPGALVGPGFPATTGLNVTPNINGMLSFLGNGATWNVFIDALKDQGLLKVLAEPTLIALSGKSANFLAGGEFPIPIPQPSAAGAIITIQYKPFGVGLNFTPTVLSDNKINMQVAPEVSELDFSQAISLQGFVIPALTTRRVSTTIEPGGRTELRNCRSLKK